MPDTDPRALRITVMANALATHCAISFVLCVLYGLTLGDPSVHVTVFEAVFPGFTWITWPSFFLGVAEIVIYGWYAGGLFAVLHNFYAARAR